MYIKKYLNDQLLFNYILDKDITCLLRYNSYALFGHLNHSFFFVKCFAVKAIFLFDNFLFNNAATLKAG